MLVRAVVVWLVLLALAVGNGAFREKVVKRRLGESAGHVVSTLLLALLILALSWATIGWIRPGTARGAWEIGGLWVGMTLAFEFLAGHYLFRTPWPKLLADYDVSRGRVWVLIPMTTLLAPVWAYRARFD